MLRVKKSLQLKIGCESPIYLMLMGMMAILIASPLRIYAFVSLGTWTIVASCLLAFVLSFNQKSYSYILIAFFWLVGITVISLFCSDFSYSQVVVAICFLEIPLLMTSYSEIKNDAIKKAIYVCYTILSVYYIILSLSSRSNVYYNEYGPHTMPFLTLGYANPNETAMLLFVCVVVLVSYFGQLKKLWTKILLGLDIAWLFVLIFLTLSRTATILCVVFVIAVFFYRKKTVPYWICAVALLAPLVYVLFTVNFSEVMKNLNVLGETAETGRLDIYKTVLENMNFKRLIIGDFSYRFQNLHNGYMSIFATTGLLGASAFILFLYMKYNDLHRFAKDIYQNKAALIGLCAMVFYTSVEAALITAGSVYAASVISVYFLCISKAEKVTE